MRLLTRLKHHFADLYRGGPRFFIGSITAGLSRSETVTVTLPGGSRMAVRPHQSDFDTLRQVFRDLDYCLPDQAAERVDRQLRQIQADGDMPVIIDAGANIGAATVWLKARFPGATVIAIEPDPSNATMARRNVEGLHNVIVVQAAVGGATGFVSMEPAHQAWAVKTERAEAGCAIVTIDQAVAMVPRGRLLLAKIDIEGFESDVFDGDLRWMDDVCAVYLEPHDWMLPGKGSSRSFQAAFGSRDFEIFLRGENLIYSRRESSTV